MKKTYLEKMGLEPVDKLNKSICKKRVLLIKKKLKRNEFSGRLRKQAMYYANWYSWLLKNGGTRSAQ